MPEQRGGAPSLEAWSARMRAEVERSGAEGILCISLFYTVRERSHFLDTRLRQHSRPCPSKAAMADQRGIHICDADERWLTIPWVDLGMDASEEVPLYPE